ncbi:MAG TPA: hypothetical protein QGF58_13220 [Myxococcota bacterium]|nr:hypothetical protein [Myxococcota bacterium]
MLVLLTLACDAKVDETGFTEPETLEDCASVYTIEAGYGYDDDELWQLSAKSPQLIDDTYCSIDERACDHDSILPREAARCMGEFSGLGDDDYDIDLHYRGPDNTLVWVVEALNWGERGSTTGWGGNDADIDAWNENAVLATGTWDDTNCQSGFS